MAVSEDRFIEVVNSVFHELAEPLTLHTRFRELEEWSSMQALILIASVDEHFGVTFPERQFRTAVTVSDLYQLLCTLQHA